MDPVRRVKINGETKVNGEPMQPPAPFVPQPPAPLQQQMMQNAGNILASLQTTMNLTEAQALQLVQQLACNPVITQSAWENISALGRECEVERYVEIYFK